MLIANAMLVPAWATWENFRDLEDRGLTMYGQMTAGSWIYIGTQGILQGTYETLAAVARRHFGGTLSRPARGHRRPRRHGRRPAAGRDDERRAPRWSSRSIRSASQRRLATRYLDEATDSLDEALDAVAPLDARRRRRARSACAATPPTCCRRWSRAASRPTC